MCCIQRHISGLLWGKWRIRAGKSLSETKKGKAKPQVTISSSNCSVMRLLHCHLKIWFLWAHQVQLHPTPPIDYEKGHFSAKPASFRGLVCRWQEESRVTSQDPLSVMSSLNSACILIWLFDHICCIQRHSVCHAAHESSAGIGQNIPLPDHTS